MRGHIKFISGILQVYEIQDYSCCDEDININF